MRFAFIGLGRAARAFHLPALKHVAQAVVVGGYDSAAEQRAAWRQDTGLEAFESLDELFERAQPEAVVVATPPDSHAAYCISALERGAHVYCEKPFVSTVEEADRVLEAADAAGRRVAVNHQYREKPIFRAIRERIGTPEAGRLVFCQLWQLMELAPWNESVAWRAGMARRTLLEGGIHLVDLMLTFFGEPPEAVYARHSAGFHADPEADAIQLVTVEFPEGRLGQITIDRLCPAATRYLEVRADCERASLRASIGGRAYLRVGMKRAERSGLRIDYGTGGLAWSERGTRRSMLARNPRDAGVSGTAELLKGFVAAIEEGGAPPSSGREARDGIAVIEAAYESARTGGRIQLHPRPAQVVA